MPLDQFSLVLIGPDSVTGPCLNQSQARGIANNGLSTIWIYFLELSIDNMEKETPPQTKSQLFQQGTKQCLLGRLQTAFAPPINLPHNSPHSGHHAAL